MGIVPVSCDSDGLAIIAVRTTAVGNLGHVGVGFQNDDDTWTIGGVEGDPDKTILLGAVVPPIFGDNGGWVEEHKTLQEVAVIFHSLDYDGLKIIQVIDDDPNLANFQIKSFPTRGYNVVNNNCLSATIDVLSAYGVKNLPLQITNVAPNDYYAHVQGDEEYLWDSNKKMYTNIVSGSSLIRIDQKSPQEALAAAKETMARAYANRDEIQPEAVPETSSQASKSPVTLTLYVHDGNPNGPIIPGAQVTANDNSGSSFQGTTNANGYVKITGDPGTWSFTASADGYEINSWDQKITKTDTKDAFLQKEKPLSQGSESQPDISKGLVAYYPFDGDANDASGNGNNGMLNGDARFVSAIKGMGLKLGGVHSPGGTTNPDYVLVKNSPSLQFTDSMTVSYFVMIDGTQAQTNADCSGSLVNAIYGTVLGKSGDRTGFYCSERDTSDEFGIDPNTGGYSMGSGPLPSLFNNYRHVVYTIGDNTINLYIDGVLKNTMTASVSFDKANTQDMYIGVQNDESGACLKYWYPLEGIIDELRIYNRVLNKAEVSQLFKDES